MRCGVVGHLQRKLILPSVFNFDNIFKHAKNIWRYLQEKQIEE